MLAVGLVRARPLAGELALFDHLRGIPARSRSGQGSLAGREAAFVVHPLMLWDDPADDEAVIGWGRAFRDCLRDHVTGTSYLNFAGDEGQERVRSQFHPAARAELARLKAEWDPENVFRASGNQALAGS